MKQIIHNIRIGKGTLTGTLSSGATAVAFYTVNRDESVTVDSVTVIENDGSYELDPAAGEVDLEELADVVDMKLGNFATTRSLNYLKQSRG